MQGCIYPYTVGQMSPHISPTIGINDSICPLYTLPFSLSAWIYRPQYSFTLHTVRKKYHLYKAYMVIFNFIIILKMLTSANTPTNIHLNLNFSLTVLSLQKGVYCIPWERYSHKIYKMYCVFRLVGYRTVLAMLMGWLFYKMFWWSEPVLKEGDDNFLSVSRIWKWLI